MKSAFLSAVWIGLLASAGVFVGCSDNDELPSKDEHGGAECEVVAELCHEVETAAGQDCHERAHSARGAACHELFSDCVKTCVPEASETGADARCAALGELCHPVDDGDGPLGACHDLGHVNDSARCESSFDDCAARCLSAREELEGTPSEGGAGAGGGASDDEHGHTSAGASAGGAG